MTASDDPQTNRANTSPPRSRRKASKQHSPKAGDVLHLTRAASAQFINPIMFRVIRVLDWVTYDHWVWLDGYQLDHMGDAVARRSVFVQISALVQINTPSETDDSHHHASRRLIKTQTTSRPHAQQHRSSS